MWLFAVPECLAYQHDSTIDGTVGSRPLPNFGDQFISCYQVAIAPRDGDEDGHNTRLDTLFITCPGTYPLLPRVYLDITNPEAVFQLRIIDQFHR